MNFDIFSSLFNIVDEIREHFFKLNVIVYREDSFFFKRSPIQDTDATSAIALWWSNRKCQSYYVANVDKHCYDILLLLINIDY